MKRTGISRQSILMQIGLLMTALFGLALVGMISSVIIAETTQGVATAVNQSGSLRMQSFRIATGLASLDLLTQPGYPHPAQELIGEFERRFTSPRLTDAIPADPEHQLRRAYERVAAQWSGLIGPLVRYQVENPTSLGHSDNTPPGLDAGYLRLVDGFVANIDDMVRRLEEYAEGKIEFLRLIQATCLLATIGILVIGLILIHYRLIAPLRNLLSCAEHARRGDFSHRSRYLSNSELGRLGQAFNVMSEDLSKIYADLERRVREKTEDLAQKNRSLDLLYRTSRQVNNVPIDGFSLVKVLNEIEQQLGLGPGTICLQNDNGERPGSRLTSTRQIAGRNQGICWQEGCRACALGSTEIHDCDLADGSVLRMMCFPIRERERQFGTLLIDLQPGQELEAWQRKVLETVAGHIGGAIDNLNRTREDRRLALHEERGVIARELHDSLAQSLSYLKIQITRLDAGLMDNGDIESARTVVAELREGVTSAYRQLRELLTTFRLKMDGRGLNRTLVETVQEFRNRSTVDIALHNALPSSLLGPNEEIHVLQIIREALSNILRHSQASSATIRLTQDDGEVQVLVEDNGQGLHSNESRPQHYGTTIMNERAQSLGGKILIHNAPGGGAQVRLVFRCQPHPAKQEMAHAH